MDVSGGIGRCECSSVVGREVLGALGPRMQIWVSAASEQLACRVVLAGIAPSVSEETAWTSTSWLFPQEAPSGRPLVRLPGPGLTLRGPWWLREAPEGRHEDWLSCSRHVLGFCLFLRTGSSFLKSQPCVPLLLLLAGREGQSRAVATLSVDSQSSWEIISRPGFL